MDRASAEREPVKLLIDICILLCSLPVTAGVGVFGTGLTLRRPAVDAVAGPERQAARADGEAPYLAPYVPTPQEVVDRMLELAKVADGDVVYDLGSGDGRVVITAAARYGVKAVGFEIDPSLVTASRDRVREAGLEHLVEIREEDIQTADLSPATVVTLYLYPDANLRLRSRIMRQLKPGSRVVSHQYAMGNWQPDRVDRIKDSMGHLRTLYLWRIEDDSRPKSP